MQFPTLRLEGGIAGRLRSVMRCYFMRDGKIDNMELLRDGSDEDLILQAKRLFKEHNAAERYD